MTNLLGVSFWEDHARPASHIATRDLPTPRSVDVVVVGAGYTGLSTARRLVSKHGLETVVIEAGAVGGGASGRNAGMVVPSIGKVPLAERVAKWGLERTRESLRLGYSAVQQLRQLIEAELPDVRMEPASWAIEAMSRESATSLEGRVDLYRRLGFDDAARFEPSDTGGVARTFGALVHSGCGLVQPLELARSLARSASDGGATLIETTTTLEVSRDGAGVVVRTTKGRLRARVAVFATNAYTSARMHRFFAGRVARFRGYAVVTAPLTVDQWREVTPIPDRFATDARDLARYWRRLPDGRMLFGGPGPVAEWSSDQRGARLVARDLRRRFPHLGDVPIEYAWKGLLAAARDRMPHVALLDGIGGYAMGYAGTGIALSILSGRALADLIVGVSSEAATVGEPLPRFPASPLVPLYPTGARALYAIKDRR